MEYTKEQLEWIDEEMKKIGVDDYRFCLENNRYVCDKQGNIYSVCRHNNNSILWKVTKMKLFHEQTGYLYVSFCTDRKIKHFKVHRIIANAFWGEHPTLVVNHKDKNRTNNRLENLEFCTQKENMIHAFKNRKKQYPFTIHVYLLNKFFNFSYYELCSVFSTDYKKINLAIEKTENILSHIELTNEQIQKVINEVFEMDDIRINKELLKKYLEREDRQNLVT
ncbi:MAG: HNH endonuclease [Ruminococcus sp.]|nr:HNH endonuclease [Ruminococcus sp.]